ncbi:unnamed protein product [Paramecium octaurelia]|uniref:Tetratricopeptide repeat protein n=1 Tax=Paramecium octaurelia TaxID=43137 RepID=A0A8S1VTJ5_PAROT|nr:unnamed protein product [Paramecium octaurelia]
MHQIYRCQYLNHSDQEIIGICLNPSCKQTRQYCYKCLMDNQLHQNCRNNFQKINQIEEVIQTKLNYLEYLQYQLSQKLKVLEKAWLNWMTELQQEQAKIVKILESLKNHNFFLLKQNLPSVIQFFLSLQNDNNHNKFQKGLRLAKSCDLLNAIKIFDEILKNDEKYPDCYYQKGLALMKIDKKRQDYLQKSVECFRKAIEMNKFHFDAYKNQGICLFQLEQYDQALKCFTSAITYGIYDKECLLYKAKILQKKDENFEACNILDKIINQDSQDLEPYFYKGVYLIQVEVYPYIIQKSMIRHRDVLIKLLVLIQIMFKHISYRVICCLSQKNQMMLEITLIR